MKLANFVDSLRSLAFVDKNTGKAFDKDVVVEESGKKIQELNNSIEIDESSSKQKRHGISQRTLEICLAEITGTYMLMFFGCMSLISGFNKEPVPAIQPALMFGFVVSTIIVIFGHISRAHLNPSVTMAALVLGDVSLSEAMVYILSQCIGATLGYATLGVITPQDILNYGIPDNSAICMTLPHPAVSDLQAILAEFLCTSLLVLTCCGVWDHRNSNQGDAVPIKFAFVVALCSVTVGPYTGASMNPARSLAPALVSGIWTKQWIYWTAPLAAGVVAPFIYMVFFERQRLKRNRSDPTDMQQTDLKP